MTGHTELLANVRMLILHLPKLDIEQVDELVNLEIAGQRRRSVILRLAQRAARLEGNRIHKEIIERFNHGP